MKFWPKFDRRRPYKYSENFVLCHIVLWKYFLQNYLFHSSKEVFLHYFRQFLENYTQRQWKVTSIKVSISRIIYNTALWLLLRSCFWSTTSWFGEMKQLHDSWNYGAIDARAFYAFCSLLEFEIIIFRRQHARTCPRHFHWKRHQNGLGFPIKREKWGSNFKVAPKLCVFLYNAMESTWVH